MSEKEELRSSLTRLRLEIDGLVSGKGSGGGENDKGEQPRRLELLHEMELAYHRLAEVEELEFVDEVKRESLKTGKIETPVLVYKLGECPLCLEGIEETLRYDDSPKFSRIMCCGTACCVRCNQQVAVRLQEAQDALMELEATPGGFSKSDWKAKKAEYEQFNHCPFCRNEFFGQDEFFERLLQHANAGKDWAQHNMATQAMSSGDFLQAERWLRLAAKQGNVCAQAELSHFWKHGHPKYGIQPSQKKALQYMLSAARAGSGQAQNLWANEMMTKGDHDEARLWYSLSATQGCRSSQGMLGFMHYSYALVHEDDDVSIYKSIYWLRQAAIRGESQSQEKLSTCLLLAKEQLFGECGIAGYSAVPEAAFWYDCAAKDKAKAAKYSFERSSLLDIVQCACCKKARGGIIVLKRCVRCKAVGYCDRECQEQHWKMGHKVDCKGVDEWRKAMKDQRAKETETMPMHY